MAVDNATLRESQSPATSRYALMVTALLPGRTVPCRSAGVGLPRRQRAKVCQRCPEAKALHSGSPVVAEDNVRCGMGSSALRPVSTTLAAGIGEGMHRHLEHPVSRVALATTHLSTWNRHAKKNGAPMKIAQSQSQSSTITDFSLLGRVNSVQN